MTSIAKSIASVTALLCMLWPSVTLSDEDQVTQDIRCLIFGMKMQKSSNTAVKVVSAGEILFFMGRLDGKLSEPEFDDRVAKEVLKIDHEGNQAQYPHCGALITEKGQVLTRLGDYLQQRGNATKNSGQ